MDQVQTFLIQLEHLYGTKAFLDAAQFLALSEAAFSQDPEKRTVLALLIQKGAAQYLLNWKATDEGPGKATAEQIRDSLVIKLIDAKLASKNDCYWAVSVLLSIIGGRADLYPSKSSSTQLHTESAIPFVPLIADTHEEPASNKDTSNYGPKEHSGSFEVDRSKLGAKVRPDLAARMRPISKDIGNQEEGAAIEVSQKKAGFRTKAILLMALVGVSASYIYWPKANRVSRDAESNISSRKVETSFKPESPIYRKFFDAVKQQKYDEAINIVRPYADKGDTEALFRLAEMYYKGQGTAIDREAAIDLLRKAAGEGHQDATKVLQQIDVANKAPDSDAVVAVETNIRRTPDQAAPRLSELSNRVVGMIDVKEEVRRIARMGGVRLKDLQIDGSEYSISRVAWVVATTENNQRYCSIRISRSYAEKWLTPSAPVTAFDSLRQRVILAHELAHCVDWYATGYMGWLTYGREVSLPRGLVPADVPLRWREEFADLYAIRLLKLTYGEEVAKDGAQLIAQERRHISHAHYSHSWVPVERGDPLSIANPVDAHMIIVKYWSQ